MKQYLNTFDKKETIKATKQVKLYQMMKRSIIKFKNVDIMIRFIAKTDGKNALNQKGARKQMGDTFQHRP